MDIAPLAKSAGMKLDEVRALLNCDVICGSNRLDSDITECFAADMMSDVLAFCKPRAMLITGLTGVQSIHTADVAELTAILFVLNKKPVQQVLDILQAKQIPVLSTPYTMFEACGLLYGKGLKGGYHERDKVAEESRKETMELPGSK